MLLPINGNGEWLNAQLTGCPADFGADFPAAD
jgi:hypothetical protein